MPKESGKGGDKKPKSGDKDKKSGDKKGSDKSKKSQAPKSKWFYIHKAYLNLVFFSFFTKIYQFR